MKESHVAQKLQLSVAHIGGRLDWIHPKLEVSRANGAR